MTKAELIAALAPYNDDAQVEVSMPTDGEPTWFGIVGVITYAPATPDHALLKLTDEPIMY